MIKSHFYITTRIESERQLIFCGNSHVTSYATQRTRRFWNWIVETSSYGGRRMRPTQVFVHVKQLAKRGRTSPVHFEAATAAVFAAAQIASATLFTVFLSRLNII